MHIFGNILGAIFLAYSPFIVVSKIDYNKIPLRSLVRQPTMRPDGTYCLLHIPQCPLSVRGRVERQPARQKETEEEVAKVTFPLFCDKDKAEKPL